MIPRLRDSGALTREPYPIGRIPRDLVTQIGKRIIYRACTGRKDLTGDDWGDIFAMVTGGEHLSSPVGIADVVKEGTAWSMKTVKCGNPFTQKAVRLISGRCSPDYSFGITDPHEDIQKTGEAVLSIWNARVDIAFSHYGRVRVCVLVRDDGLRRFALFEEYLDHYNIADFEWKENSRSNLEGFNRQSGLKQFVWQPHGSQFTICTPVPEGAIKFELHEVPELDFNSTLQAIGFDSSWVKILTL